MVKIKDYRRRKRPNDVKITKMVCIREHSHKGMEKDKEKYLCRECREEMIPASVTFRSQSYFTKKYQEKEHLNREKERLEGIKKTGVYIDKVRKNR